ncbi:MAG: ribonuclease domain-containing protein [Burkholderiales bacterium]
MTPAPRRAGWRALAAVLLWAAGLFGAAAIAPLVGDAIARGEARSATSEIFHAALPHEAQQVLQAIRRGGPYTFERDGVVFANYERQLPVRRRGYYREYTVPTPGAHSRGARRIIAGTDAEYYYTDDHYRTFRRIRE